MESSTPLEQASQYVNSSWFPMATEAAFVLREKILHGSYRQQKTAAPLLKDIRADFALYTFCLREVHGQADSGAGELSNCSHATLLQLLQSSPQRIDMSATREVGPLQRLSQVLPLASAVVADEVASQVGIEGEQAFSCALLRQLGITLITWNYPHVVASAVASVRPGTSLDFVLSRRLGFSPALLGLMVTREWGLDQEVRYAMGEKASLQLKPELVERAELLRRICRTGEMLTRVEHPAYPSAQADYQEALRQLESLAGRQGMKRIRERLELECLFVLQSLPAVLVSAPLESLETSERLGAPEESACPEEFLRSRHVVESLITSTREPEAALRALRTKLFPLSGFEQGCLYVLDPDALSLVPRLTLGTATLDQLKAIPLESTFPVSRAFREGQQLIKRDARGVMHYVLLALGRPKRIGVLFLAPQLTNGSSAHSEQSLLATSLVLKQLLDMLV